MISVALHNIGKRFNREWIFRGLTCEIDAGQKLVILGGNGSGKSTLLQVISGFVTPNEGKIEYSLTQDQLNSRVTDQESIKNHISFASPYIQLVEDFTLPEMIEHTRIFKPFVGNFSTEQIIELIQVQDSKNKFIRQFSSGMKQRLKLGLAILADTPLLLLDEPVSNLDKNAIAWYKQLITDYTKERTVIVCSNAITEEYFFCDKELNVSGYKPAK